ncbi:alpha/beta fold hydrolase [Streptomyces ipomoeae]|jgi:pimeloyl-ACP methyl ester carboxylesterase|uniref:alpha/beta fold hydrolase n=1 Tax=Streptomyces ipomoeae TaxID=103232 RepID=UPI0029A9384F|nr:alpha/beta fold hydrolase [Streptomyces ipomoeae]MDX2820212.1 alpha/beta fold hydrolase [Streptomyces ipomoeae]MDX2874928.1 alpha/beta fold hydrolase [Streptomyces ipomoeae]
MRSAHRAALAAAVLLAAVCVPVAEGVPVAQGAQGAQGAARPSSADHPSALDRYYNRRPAWCRCQSQAPAAYQCADITVPLDYARPTGPTLRLRISRLRTSVPGKRRGVLLSNPGGPSTAALGDPLQLNDSLSKKVKDHYDLIGFDPRGLATSSPLRCGLNQDEVTPFRPYRSATYAEDVARARDIATKCASRDRARLPYINTRNTARDMDVIRGVLGEKKISYVGWSYGTYLGAVYTQLFPRHTDRFVLDSAVAPGAFGRGTWQAMASGSEPAFREWSRLTAREDRTYHLGDTPAKVRAAFWKLVARADRTPLRYEGSDEERRGQALTGADIRDWLRPEFFDAPGRAAREVVALRKARATRPDPGPTGRADSFEDNATALYWAIMCGDNSASWPRDPARYRHDAVRDGARYPVYGDFASTITPCAFWPRGSEPATRVDNRVRALVVHNQWDSQTPLSSGRAMHRALHGSRLVYVAGGRGHAVYGFPGAPKCVTRTVDAYLTEGRFPGRDITCRSQRVF